MVLLKSVMYESYLVGGWAGDHGVCGWLVDGLASDVVLVSDLDGARSSVDGAGSDNAVLDVGAGDGGASMDLLPHVAWARGESRDGTDGAIGSNMNESVTIHDDWRNNDDAVRHEAPCRWKGCTYVCDLVKADIPRRRSFMGWPVVRDDKKIVPLRA